MMNSIKDPQCIQRVLSQRLKDLRDISDSLLWSTSTERAAKLLEYHGYSVVGYGTHAVVIDLTDVKVLRLSLTLSSVRDSWLDWYKFLRNTKMQSKCFPRITDFTPTPYGYAAVIPRYRELRAPPEWYKKVLNTCAHGFSYEEQRLRRTLINLRKAGVDLSDVTDNIMLDDNGHYILIDPIGDYYDKRGIT